jgi:hypothetical protein
MQSDDLMLLFSSIPGDMLQEFDINGCCLMEQPYGTFLSMHIKPSNDIICLHRDIYTMVEL